MTVGLGRCRRGDLVGRRASAEELQADLRAVAELCQRQKGSLAFRAELVPGQTVTVDAGTFAGCRGVIVRRRGATELVVNVPVLGSSVAVTLDAEMVSA